METHDISPKEDSPQRMAQRVAVSLAALYFYFGFSTCLLLATLMFVVINLTLLIQDDQELKKEPPKEKVDEQEQQLLKDASNGETMTKTCNHDLSMMRDYEKKYKEFPEPITEDFSEELCTHLLPNEYKEQCIQRLDLEAENEDLKSKLVAACESLEYYRKREQDKKSIVEEAVNDALQSYNLMHQEVVIKLEEKRLEWDEERNDLLRKLYAANSLYEYFLRATRDYELYTNNLVQERNYLSSKLQRVNTVVETYKACLDDCEEVCRKLWEENSNLSAELSAAATSAEQYYKLLIEMDKKCRDLEEEAKFSAATEALYHSYLLDFMSS